VELLGAWFMKNNFLSFQFIYNHSVIPCPLFNMVILVYSYVISTSVCSGTSKFVSSAYLNNILLLDLGHRSLSIIT